jgi:hypothetical protein
MVRARGAGRAAPVRVGGAGPVARGAGPLAMNQVATAATSSNPASSNPASILENLKLSDAKANIASLLSERQWMRTSAGVRHRG